MKYILGLSFLCFSLVVNAQNWDDTEIIPTKLTDNIYMLTGAGGNIGLSIGEDGVLMIDDQFAPLSDKITAAVASLSKNKIHYLINTHWHGDHTGGNENFALNGATIIAHDNVRHRLSTDQVRPFGHTTKASPKVAWPQLTFNDQMNVHFNSESIQLIHVHNAHTDGDAFVFFPIGNVLHMGDCFFKDRFPYVDLEMGGSPDGAIKAVEMALMIVDENTQIIPGHGSIASREDLLRYLTMFTTMRERVKDAIAAGRTFDENNVALLTEGYESWGSGFINADKMVKMLFSAYESN